jgi:hypothetical protein
MERSMKNVLNLLGTEMGRIRELTTTSQQIKPPKIINKNWHPPTIDETNKKQFQN